METAILSINGDAVFNGATFQRLPQQGEFVAYENQWMQVTGVFHTWNSATKAPVAQVTLQAAQHALEEEIPAGPIGPFPTGS